MPETIENQDNSFKAKRELLIQAAILHVPFTGWSYQTLEGAAKDTNISQELASILFPYPQKDMPLAFHHWCDKQLLKNVDNTFQKMRIREKITYMVRKRLEILAPYKDAVRRSVSLFSLPPYVLSGARALWQTVDLIWDAVGDTSEDHNWYTKRATLMGVYTSTLMYYLDDTSEENNETWAFLDRRIENVMSFEKTKWKMKKSNFLQALSKTTEKLPIGIRRPGNFSTGTESELPGQTR